MKRTIIIAIFAPFLTGMLIGCASLPKQTVLLSGHVQKMVAESERTHMALLDQYVEQRQGRIDDFMHYVWTPRFIVNFLDKPKVKKRLKSDICKDDGLDRAVTMQKLVESISRKEREKRIELERALRDTERQLRQEVRDHYNQLRMAADALSSNLRSVHRSKQMHRDLVEALGVPKEKIASFDKASSRLDKMLVP